MSSTSESENAPHAASSEDIPAVPASKSVIRLRKKRSDWVIVAVLVICALVCVGVVYTRSAYVHTDHVVASEESTKDFLTHQVGSYVPSGTLSEAWSSDSAYIPTVQHVIMINGVLIVGSNSGAAEGMPNDGTGTVQGLDARTGEKLWSYSREDVPLCLLSAKNNRVVAGFRTEFGCGEVTSLVPESGEYMRVRAAIAPENTLPIESNDSVGQFSDQWSELWRFDLVRTIEYGVEPAPSSPHQGGFDSSCAIQNALTRKNLYAVLEHCGDDAPRVQLMNTTPENSGQPEITGTFVLPDSAEASTRDVRLIAIAEKRAAVAVFPNRDDDPSYTGMIYVTDEKGTLLSSEPLPAGTVPVDPDRSTHTEITQDLTHNITWFDQDAHRIIALNPTYLTIDHVIADALGPALGTDDYLVYPTREGFSLLDASSWQSSSSFPVNRDGYSGLITIALGIGVIVEKRGDDVFVWQSS